MLDFKPVDVSCSSFLEPFYKDCSYRSCEYSIGTKCFWNSSYPYEYCFDSGCLIIKYLSDGETVFDFPVAGKEGNIISALDAIDDYCTDNEIKPCFSDVPKEGLSVMTARYPHMRIDSSRSVQDYIYRKEDLAQFPGKAYSTQRNHLHQFLKAYPTYTFRELTDKDDLSSFFEEYRKEYGEFDESASEEFEIAKAMAQNCTKINSLLGACIEVNSKIIGFSIGEICNDTMIIHIEKGLYSYKGIYQALVSDFIKHFATDKVLFINREEDDGEKGLRTSKLRYRPCTMLDKYIVRAFSELEDLTAFPEIKTQRLTISEIADNDKRPYFILNTDDKNNEFWGYDYRKDLTGELTESFFTDMVKEDFINHTCLSLGIHLDNLLIGEAVVYNPDYKGKLEIGCRLLKEYQGNGYAAEAFSAISDWALYNLDCRKICAKCFKDNQRSYKMISSVMELCKEDNRYYYFEKSV